MEGIIIGASLLEPYMPETAEKIAKQLNTSLRDFDQLEQFGLYESGSKVTDQPEILFARLDMKDVAKKEAELEEAMIKAAAEHEAQEANAEAEKAEQEAIDIEPKAEIEYDDFAKMQFQVGEIISCEAVPKSKKLLCSQVKIGSQVRQIVSGIKAHYSPEEMVGKKVMVLVNLKPAKLAGVLSEGMILCAEDAEGNLISEAANDENGSVIFDKIDYDEPGTFNYVVYEVGGDAEGVTYDENRYDVTVSVKDSEKGYLTADVTGDEGLTFVNVYEKPEAPAKTDDGDGPAKTSDNAIPGMLMLILAASGAGLVALRKKSR